MAEGEGAMAYGANDVEIVHESETVGPNDRPAHRASDQALRDIEEALRDASTHGTGQTLEPFVPDIEPFISPTLPGR
jgi:hypothetical protein